MVPLSVLCKALSLLPDSRPGEPGQDRRELPGPPADAAAQRTLCALDYAQHTTRTTWTQRGLSMHTVHITLHYTTHNVDSVCRLYTLRIARCANYTELQRSITLHYTQHYTQHGLSMHTVHTTLHTTPHTSLHTTWTHTVHTDNTLHTTQNKTLHTTWT